MILFLLLYNTLVYNILTCISVAEPTGTNPILVNKRVDRSGVAFLMCVVDS